MEISAAATAVKVSDDRRRTVFRKTGDNRRIFPEGDSGTPERVIVYI